MAASLRFICNLASVSKNVVCNVSRCSKRHLLSGAYACDQTWEKHLTDPTFKDVTFSDFAYQIREQLERTGKAFSVDVNILSHVVHQMDEDEVEFLEDILARFNRCQYCLPRNDSTSHALVRGFIAAGQSSQLPGLLSDRLTYGVFPNHYTLNLLLDHFLVQGDHAMAAQVAYFSALQEDFSNPLNTLLSLQACTQHLIKSNLDDLAPPPKEASDGEEDWIKVQYITYPFYDDHFHIKDERFLLGKTLILLSQSESVQIPEVIKNSVRLIGCGIYHKFSKGLALLQEISESGTSLPQVALDYFSHSLENVEARDPEEPEVELALRTQDDEIRKWLPTTEEKNAFLANFAELGDKLKSQEKITPDFDLFSSIEEFVKANQSEAEAPEISKQEQLFKVWAEDRQREIDRQVEEFRRRERIEEMKQQVKELQEQEEVLTYFDNEEKIRLKFLDDDLKETNHKLSLSK